MAWTSLQNSLRSKPRVLAEPILQNSVNRNALTAALGSQPARRPQSGRRTSPVPAERWRGHPRDGRKVRRASTHRHDIRKMHTPHHRFRLSARRGYQISLICYFTHTEHRA